MPTSGDAASFSERFTTRNPIHDLEICAHAGNYTADAEPCSIDEARQVFFKNDEDHGTGTTSPQDNTKLEKEQAVEQNRHTDHGDSANDNGSSNRGFKFWLILTALCMTSLLGGLDTTVTATALATISSEIGGKDQYVWFANVATVTMTAVQPFFGQLANIFGRRYMTLFAVGIFILGSAISGAAVGPGMLISGRAVQGIGTGALMMLQDLIVCDLVPLRERGKYISIFTASAGVAASFGPLIGGAIAQWNWRWIFYINLPIGGLAFIAVALLLHTKHTRSPTWLHALMRIDFTGNVIFMAAVVALLLGVVMGGQNVFPWSSWRVVLPLVIGVVGLIAFVLYEKSPACKEPIIPLQLFGNRTSAIAFVLAFCSGMILQWASYFLPVFYQGVQLSTPLQSGIYLIPMNVTLIVMAIVAGNLVAITGKYLPQHFVSFALLALAMGLFSRFDRNTPVVEWVFLQMVAGSGMGLTMNTPLVAIQASLPDTLNAAATATFGFIHSLAFIWGVTIPAVIFNADVSSNIGRYNLTSDTQDDLARGRALGSTTRSFLMSIIDTTERDEIVLLFTHAVRMTWYASMVAAIIGLLLCFGEKQIRLRTALENDEFGMEDKSKRSESS